MTIRRWEDGYWALSRHADVQRVSATGTVPERAEPVPPDRADYGDERLRRCS